MEKNDEIVVFRKYYDPVNANIVKGVLESNGVIAGVTGDSIANALMMTRYNVMVFRRDLQRAEEIMQASPVEDIPADQTDEQP